MCTYFLVLSRLRWHAGGASAADAAIFVCPAGICVGDSFPDLLRCHRLLVMLHDHMAVCRVSDQEREGGCHLQEPCYSGPSNFVFMEYIYIYIYIYIYMFKPQIQAL
jgi:hypothetical protein